MKPSDWALLALNVLAGFVAFIAATEGGEAAVWSMIFTLPALLLSSVVLVRRARNAEGRPARKDRRPATDEDLDARQLLDIDARLEALEKAEERRLRALYEEGVISGPSAPLAEADRRTGRRVEA